MSHVAVRHIALDAADAEYTLTVKQNGGVLSGTTLELVEADVQWEPDREVLPRIAPSRVEVSALFERNRDLLSDLAGAGETDFLLEINRDGSPWWRGYLIPDLQSDTTDELEEPLLFEAADGLHLLQSGLYQNGSAPWEEGDRATPLAILAELLSVTGLDLDIYLAPRLHPFGLGEGVNPLAAVTLDRSRFNDDSGDASSPGTPQTPYTALLQLLNDLGLTLVQRGGAWHVVDLSLLQAGSYTAFVYDHTGASQGTTVINDTVTPDAINAGGRAEDREAIQTSSRTYNHGPVDVLVDGTFEGAPYDAGWTEHGGTFSDFKRFDRAYPGTNERGSAMGIKGVFASVDEEGGDLQLYAGVRYRKLVSTAIAEIHGATLRHMVSGRYYTEGAGQPVSTQEPRVGFWARKIGNYWLQPDGSWAAGSGGIGWMSIDLVPQWDGVLIDSEIPIGGGTIETYLGVVVDNKATPSSDPSGHEAGPGSDGNHTSADPDYDIWALWDDALCTIQFADGEEEWTATTTTLASTESTGSGVHEASSRFGEGPTLLNPSAIHMPDGSLATRWKRGAYATGEAASSDTLEKLLAEGVIRANRVPQARYRIDLVTAFAGDVLPLTRVLVDGKPTTALELRRSLAAGTVSGDFDEVSDTAVLTQADIVRDEAAQVYVDPSGLAKLYVEDSGLVAALETAIATTTATLRAGVETSAIPIGELDATLEAFEAGRRMTMINRATGRRTLVTMAVDAVEGDEALLVEAFTPTEDIWLGSGITTTDREVQSSFSVTQDAIRAAISADAIALLTNATTSGEGTYTFRTTPTKAFLERGAQLSLITPKGDSVTLYLYQDAAKGSRRLTVSAIPVDLSETLPPREQVREDLPVDTVIRVAHEYRQTESIQTAFDFSQYATRAELRDVQRQLLEIDRAAVAEVTNEALSVLTIGGTPAMITQRLKGVAERHEDDLRVKGTAILQNETDIDILAFDIDEVDDKANVAFGWIGVSPGQVNAGARTLVTIENDLGEVEALSNESNLRLNGFDATATLQTNSNGRIVSVRLDSNPDSASTLEFDADIINQTSLLNRIEASDIELIGDQLRVTADTVFESDVQIYGTLNGVNGSFSGTLSAAGGSFAGSLLTGAVVAGDIELTGSLKTSGVTYQGAGSGVCIDQDSVFVQSRLAGQSYGAGVFGTGVLAVYGYDGTGRTMTSVDFEEVLIEQLYAPFAQTRLGLLSSSIAGDLFVADDLDVGFDVFADAFYQGSSSNPVLAVESFQGGPTPFTPNGRLILRAANGTQYTVQAQT